jgi:hypothetical protein
MNDEQLRENILDVLYDYYQLNSAQMRHIGEIRDALQQRTSENIGIDQVTRCGIQLASRGFIRIRAHQGKPLLSGWADAIIMQEGINHIESRDGAEIT